MVGNQNHKPLGSKPYLWLLYIGFLQRERNSIFNLRIEMESKYLIWIKLISENLHLFFPEFMKNMKIKELNPQYKVNFDHNESFVRITEIKMKDCVIPSIIIKIKDIHNVNSKLIKRKSF